MIEWTQNSLLLLCATTLVGCGEFDNATIQARLQDSLDPLSCEQRLPVTLEAPVLPPLTEGLPWAGWLHAQNPQGGSLRWAVNGLPVGLSLNTETGALSGTPLQPGVHSLTITVHVVNCPESVDSQIWEIDVEPQCVEDCDTPNACEEIRRDPLSAYVVGVEPGNAIARDGLIVQWPSLPRRLGSDTTHSMVLVDPTSATKLQVVIHYTLPGGVLPPIKAGEELDLRFIHGVHGDQYLFLTEERKKPKERTTKLAVYNGHLSADELEKQCPQSGQDTHCPMTEFQIGPSMCRGWSPCGSTDLLSIEVATKSLMSKGTGWTTSRLLPGQAGELRTAALLRLADAAAEPRNSTCDNADGVPFHISFYIVPTGYCSYVELHRIDDGALPHAPSGTVFSGRVLYPTTFADVDYEWSLDGPSELAPIPSGNDQAGQLWVELPLAGDYGAFLTADVTLGGGQPMTGCEGLQAEHHFHVPPPEDHRIELSWTPTTPMTPTSDTIGMDKPILGVGPTIKGIDQAPMIQAVDLSVGPNPMPITVDHPSSSSVYIRAEVRIWANARLVFTEERTLAPGSHWDVSVLNPGQDIAAENL